MNLVTSTILVIYYDLRSNEYEIRDIGTIITNDIMSEDAYLKCTWRFSMDKNDIIFYMANLRWSKLVIWNCPMCEIKKIVDFKWSLLIKYPEEYENIAPNEAIMKHPSTPSQLIDGVGYGLPSMWFTSSYEGIILRNPFNKSFVSINNHTSHEMINAILKRNIEVEIDNLLPDPIFFGRNIFVLGEENNHKIVKIKFII